MRKFTLWNASMSQSFNFETTGCVITEVTGLGIGFNPVVQNKTVVDFDYIFEELSLQITFGINSNPYTVFNNFLNFIANNGKNNLVLEYAVNNRTLYCDVWIKSVPKTQKNTFNVLQEKVSFTRLTYWYELVTGNLPKSPSTTSITNNVLEDMPVKIQINGPTESSLQIVLTKDSVEVSKIKLTTDLITGQNLVIDSVSKKVTLISSTDQENAYNLIDHEFDTFMLIPSGTHLLNYSGEDTSITYIIKKWVID